MGRERPSLRVLRSLSTRLFSRDASGLAFKQAMPGKCHLLESIPSEIRLQIYEHLFSERCRPVLMVSNEQAIYLPLTKQSSHPGAGLVRTCRTCHDEATPFLCEAADFHLELQAADHMRVPHSRYRGPLDVTNPLMASIRHLDITIHLQTDGHVGQLLRILAVLADVLGGAKAEVEILSTTWASEGAIEDVEKAREGVVYLLEREIGNRDGQVEPHGLSRRMLRESEVVSGAYLSIGWKYKC